MISIHVMSMPTYLQYANIGLSDGNNLTIFMGLRLRTFDPSQTMRKQQPRGTGMSF